MESTKNLTIFDRVKSYRQKAGLSQEQLGEKLGVSGNYIYQIESGKKTPGDSLIKLFESIETGKTALSPNRVDELQEDGPRYKTHALDLSLIATEELTNMLTRFTAEIKSTTDGTASERNQKILTSCTAIIEELTKRIGT